MIGNIIAVIFVELCITFFTVIAIRLMTNDKFSPRITMVLAIFWMITIPVYIIYAILYLLFASSYKMIWKNEFPF